MKNLCALIMLLCASAVASGQSGALQGTSTLGGISATTQGAQSSNKLQGVIPGAQITIYLTGTQTKATLTSDGSTPLSNPFYSNLSGAINPGGFIAFASTGQGYDIVASSGQGSPNCATGPLCYAQPVTLCKDCFPSSQFTVIVGVQSAEGTAPIEVNGQSGVPVTNVPVVITCPGCALPGAPSTSIQYDCSGSFCGSNADFGGTTANFFTFGASLPVSVSTWSCDGTNCTLVAMNTFMAGEDIQTLGGFSNACMDEGALTPVLSSGLSSSQFEIAESATACSGTISGASGSAAQASGFTANGGVNGINLETAGTVNGAGAVGSINLITNVTGSYGNFGVGTIILQANGTSVGGTNISLSTNNSANNSGVISLATNASGGGGGHNITFSTAVAPSNANEGSGNIEFSTSANCTTFGCNDANVNFTLAANENGGNFNTGANFSVSLTSTGTGGASSTGANFSVATSATASGAGDISFTASNTGSATDGSFSVASTGPASFASSNFTLTAAGLLTAGYAISGPATAPSGSCTTVGWVFSRDGHATFCNGSNWSTKI